MGYIEKIFKKSGWISILESVIFVILGIILIANPEGTVTFVSWILGLIFICTGIYKTINYLSAKGKYDLYNYDLLYGILAVIIGIVTIMYVTMNSGAVVVTIGVMIIISSIIDIIEDIIFIKNVKEIF